MRARWALGLLTQTARLIDQLLLISENNQSSASPWDGIQKADFK